MSGGTGAELEAWRCIRAVLIGGPVPVIANADAQAVVEVLADVAAWNLQLGQPVLGGIALGFVEQKIAGLMFAELTGVPDSEAPPRP